MHEQQSPEPKTQKITVKQLIVSILAGLLGVQSDANRNRDFKHGSPKQFIIGGIIFVIIFLISVYSLARFALS